MRARPGNGAWNGRFATRGVTLLAAAAAIVLLVGPAQAAPPGCVTGYFTIDTIAGPVTAGDGFTVTVRAFDCADAPLTAYASSATLDGASGAEPANSPNGDPPGYGTLAWDDGVGEATVTLYAAETARQLTVSDGDLLDGTSNAFDVLPAGFDSLDFAPISTATAGTSFGVTVTAYDEFGNVQTDYAGPATLDGAPGAAPGSSPNGDAPDYGTLTWDDGEGTANVTLYKAETARQLSVEDDETSITGTSGEFDVLPGALDSFEFGSISTATAGTAFGVSVTAYDEFGNVKTDYPGGATLDGATGAAPGSSPNGDAPDYGTLTWDDGVGTANVTLYKAETDRQLTVEDGTVTATSDEFDVLPGPLDSFDVGQVGVAFGPPPHFVVEVDEPEGVSATAYDEFGNVKTDYTGGATLSGTLEGSPTYGTLSWTDGVGSGSFTAVAMSIDREVTVTDGSVTADSNLFDVVAEVCSDAASCTGTSGNGSKKVTLSTPLADGDASIGFFFPPGGTIECLLKDGTTRTINVAGAISLINPPPGYTQANPLTLTMTLAKGVASTGMGNLIVCLSKDRGASFGQIVDCGKKFKKSDIPCISSRTRTGVGESVITMLITSADPWGGIG